MKVLQKILGALPIAIAAALLLTVMPFIVLASYLSRRPRSEKGGGKPAYLLAPMVKWEGSYQRPHHLATNLAKAHEVLYFSPTPLHHAAGHWGHWWKTRRLQITPSLTVWQPLIFPGERRGGVLRRLNEWLLAAYIRKAAAMLPGDGPLVVYTNDPLWDKLVGAADEDCLVYDVIDNFAAFSWARKDAKAREQRLIVQADVVFTGTYSLYDDRKTLHADITYIPCGVDFDHFHTAASDGEIAKEMQSLEGPVLGYFGFLNERLDTDLLGEMCEKHPDWNIVLIGPIQRNFGLAEFTSPIAMVAMDPSDPAFALKQSWPNLHLLGRQDYQRLPEYLRRFDICLLPYLLDEATRAIHPVKVLEYLAAGKPVVSTAVPDVVRFYEKTVAVADDIPGYIAACEALMAEPGDRAARIDQARPITWEGMTEAMQKKVERALANSSKG